MTMIRFVMLGGFLGAGKTTSIGRLARMYMALGKKVGIVTNDQATDLVDTHVLRSQGFNVGEVPGSCFCCNFNELTATVDRIGAKERPDVVLSEPVGSCTDLVATVIRPLQQLYDAEFSVAPYGVILKPSHGARILAGEGKAGFSPKAEYIFRKQLEEADLLIVNRIDELQAPEIDRLCALLEEQFPGRPVSRVSAKTGQGFESLFDRIEESGQFGRQTLELDYDIYAEGEAELGWLNANVQISDASSFSLDDYVLGVIDDLRGRLNQEGAEPAHLKAIGVSSEGYAVANLVSSWSPTELSRPSGKRVTEANVIVNARAAVAPEVLERHTRAAVAQVATTLGTNAEIDRLQSFRPGRPVPTHRLVQITL